MMIHFYARMKKVAEYSADIFQELNILSQ